MSPGCIGGLRISDMGATRKGSLGNRKRHFMQRFKKNWTGKSLLSEYSEQLVIAIGERKNSFALRAAKIEAELASKSKSEFIANMSHELRTPLNAIMGFADMLHLFKDHDPGKIHEYSGYIKSAAEHLLKIINEILDLSKIQAEKLEISPEFIDVKDIISLCVTLVKPRAEERGVTIEEIWDVEETVLEADPLRMKQILLNLLSNAVKFTPKGGSVEVVVSRPTAQTMRITVRDTGVGMSPQEVMVAQQPFGQVKSAFSADNDGTGLGLPIAISLVQLHHGTLNIASKKEVGTKIWLDFPLRQPGLSQAFNVDGHTWEVGHG